jgi:hypothetical protein
MEWEGVQLASWSEQVICIEDCSSFHVLSFDRLLSSVRSSFSLLGSVSLCILLCIHPWRTVLTRTIPYSFFVLLFSWCGSAHLSVINYLDQEYLQFDHCYWFLSCISCKVYLNGISNHLSFFSQYITILKNCLNYSIHFLNFISNSNFRIKILKYNNKIMMFEYYFFYNNKCL